MNFLKKKKNILWVFSFIWISFFLIQYFVLGENSPISYRDNGDQALSRILHDLNHHLGGKFIHNIYGGTDYYSLAGYFGAFLELEKMIFSIFPIWIGILVHKFMLISISFFGAYLLFTRVFKFKTIDSIFVSAFLSIINPYATYQSLQHGIGFAVIYLAIYIYLYTTSNRYYFVYTTFLSIIISISLSPLHSFQAILGGLILTTFIKKPEKLKFSIISILILLLFVLINWSEVLYGLSTYGELTSRIINNTNRMTNLGGLYHIAKKGNYCFINCNFNIAPIVIISLITFAATLFNYKLKYLKMILFIIICNYLPNLGWFLTDLFNLNKIKSMNFYEYAYYLYIPISILALQISMENKKFSKIPLVFLFFAIMAVFYAKIEFFKKIYFESQNKIHLVENLNKKEWAHNQLGRTTTLFPYEQFHPNFAWVYGLETSDGWQHFILKNYQFFWDFGILRKKQISEETRYGADLYADKSELTLARNQNKQIYLNKYIDLNLLALINNKYILSYDILEEQKIKKISGPEEAPYQTIMSNEDRTLNFYLDQLKKRNKYLKKPPNINIYEIENASDRAFLPNKIIKIENKLSLNEKFNFMSKNYTKNITFSETDNHKKAMGEITKVKKIKNGYFVKAKIDREGILILNSFYNPFWRVIVNDQYKDIINYSDIHMGVKLKEGRYDIKFIYDRPLLREKLIEKFKFF